MKLEEEIRAELDRLENIVYDTDAENEYGEDAYARIAARWNALKWVLGVE